MSKVIDFTVEKKTYGKILLMWGYSPPAKEKFTVLRALNDADQFNAIAKGYYSAYLDESEEVLTNDAMVYKIKAGDVESEAVVVNIDADPYVYDAAETYLWRLKDGREGVDAVAFCKAELNQYCSECWSDELNKRIKSKCSTCDGSGMINAYKGPLNFNINLSQVVDTTNMVGMLEEETTLVNAWTGNTPLFKKGDIIIIGSDRYIVNARPTRHKITSHSNGKPFTIKQAMQLALLDYNHIAYNLEIE